MKRFIAKKHSIQRQLVVFISAAVTAVLVVGWVGIYNLVKGTLYSQIDERLKAELQVLVVEVELEDGVIEHDWLVDLLYREDMRVKDYIQVRDLQSGETVRSPSLRGEDLEQISGLLNEPVFRTITLPNGKLGRAVGVEIYPTVAVGSDGLERPENYPQVLVLSHEDEWLFSALRTLEIWLTVVAVLVNILVIGCTYFIIRNKLKPVRNLAASLRQVEPSDVGSVLDGPQEDVPAELIDLVEAYHDLLANLDDLRQREQRLAANVAHELRTPIAGLLSTIELCVIRRREPDEYLTCLKNLEEISLGMKSLVERILSLVRMENGGDRIVCEQVDLSTVLDNVVTEELSLRQGGVARAVRVVRSGLEQALVTSDPAYLGVLLRNVVSNAISYTCDGVVYLSLNRSGDKLELCVRNRAEGLTAEDLERMQQPFHRLDTNRLLDGHAGLGISLCQEVAKALKMKVEYQLVDGDFEVKLTF